MINRGDLNHGALQQFALILWAKEKCASLCSQLGNEEAAEPNCHYLTNDEIKSSPLISCWTAYNRPKWTLSKQIRAERLWRSRRSKMTHLPPFHWEETDTICMEDGPIQRPVSRRKTGRTTWFGRTKMTFGWNKYRPTLWIHHHRLAQRLSASCKDIF